MKPIWQALGLFTGSMIYGVFSYWLLVMTLWDVSSVLLMFVAAAAAFWLTIKGYRHFHSGLGKICGWLLGIGSFLLSGILLLLLLLELSIQTLGAVEYRATSESPDGRYTVDFEYFDAGAAGTFGIRGELDGPFWFTKYIYYEKRVTEADVHWKNDDTIVINGHILNLQKGEIFGYIKK